MQTASLEYPMFFPQLTEYSLKIDCSISVLEFPVRSKGSSGNFSGNTRCHQSDDSLDSALEIDEKYASSYPLYDRKLRKDIQVLIFQANSKYIVINKRLETASLLYVAHERDFASIIQYSGHVAFGQNLHVFQI